MDEMLRTLWGTTFMLTFGWGMWSKETKRFKGSQQTRPFQVYLSDLLSSIQLFISGSVPGRVQRCVDWAELLRHALSLLTSSSSSWGDPEGLCSHQRHFIFQVCCLFVFHTFKGDPSVSGFILGSLWSVNPSDSKSVPITLWRRITKCLSFRTLNAFL